MLINHSETRRESMPGRSHAALKALRMLVMLTIIGVGQGALANPATADETAPTSENKKAAPATTNENSDADREFRELFQLMIEQSKIIERIKKIRERMHDVPRECVTPRPGGPQPSKMTCRNMAVA